MQAVFAPAAAADLIAIRNYIGHFNPAAARRMALRLRSTAGSLAEFPARGRLRRDGAREFIAVHPYVIVYNLGTIRVTSCASSTKCRTVSNAGCIVYQQPKPQLPFPSHLYPHSPIHATLRPPPQRRAPHALTVAIRHLRPLHRSRPAARPPPAVRLLPTRPPVWNSEHPAEKRSTPFHPPHAPALPQPPIRPRPRPPTHHHCAHPPSALCSRQTLACLGPDD
ncbi:type II toxin-antitoxin system RelE/ParE family toxin [Azospirillum sp. TSH64]|uniref:type II toxin-antitoxin system RelE/ParE family toxin n=1 Tax=Azospirillum sp. TSH64 TaxID=652740 RepID=UPI001FFE3143|nr:type II toxin-antitoxin system RelE/ParE family toxin [Azospirillum sp. TSH64]